MYEGGIKSSSEWRTKMDKHALGRLQTYQYDNRIKGSQDPHINSMLMNEHRAEEEYFWSMIIEENVRMMSRQGLDPDGIKNGVEALRYVAARPRVSLSVNPKTKEIVPHDDKLVTFEGYDADGLSYSSSPFNAATLPNYVRKRLEEEIKWRDEENAHLAWLALEDYKSNKIMLGLREKMAKVIGPDALDLIGLKEASGLLPIEESVKFEREVLKRVSRKKPDVSRVHLELCHWLASSLWTPDERERDMIGDDKRIFGVKAVIKDLLEGKEVSRLKMSRRLNDLKWGGEVACITFELLKAVKEAKPLGGALTAFSSKLRKVYRGQFASDFTNKLLSLLSDKPDDAASEIVEYKSVFGFSGIELVKYLGDTRA